MRRYEVVVLVEQGRLTQVEAAAEMGLSERQVRWVLKRYPGLRRGAGKPGLSAQSSAAKRPVRGHRGRSPQAPRGVPFLVLSGDRRGPGNHRGESAQRSTVHRLLRHDKPVQHHRRPAQRFEMGAFGELWQMDTTMGPWLEGYKRVYVVAILDDFSRAVVAARVFASDSSYHSLLTLRQAVERYGRPRILCTDIDSKFRLTRYQHSRLRTYGADLCHGGKLVAQLPHIDKNGLRDAPLTVEQALEDILPATRERVF